MAQHTPVAPGRIWQIDFLRGVAVVGMVLYHFFFALRFFAGWEIPLENFFWVAWQKLVASTFLFLVGVSLCLSYQRVFLEGWSRAEIFWKFARRSAKIFAAGLLLTLITFWMLPEYYVRFGVLHLIGVSVLISLPWVIFRQWALPTAVAVLIFGVLKEYLPWQPGGEEFIWLGFRPAHFATLDWFPIIPWWGIVLLGVSWQHRVVQTVTRIPLPSVPLIPFLGRHALAIYLLHQPVILFLLQFLR